MRRSTPGPQKPVAANKYNEISVVWMRRGAIGWTFAGCVPRPFFSEKPEEPVIFAMHRQGRPDFQGRARAFRASSNMGVDFRMELKFIRFYQPDSGL